MALHPEHVLASQTARMYSLVVLRALVALSCLLRALREPERDRYWAGYGLALALVALTHNSGLLLGIAHALFASRLLAGGAIRAAWQRDWSQCEWSGFAAPCIQPLQGRWYVVVP